MTYVLFGGNDSGTPAIEVEWGIYSGTYDIPPSVGAFSNDVSLAFEDGTDFLTGADPANLDLPAGVFIATATVRWDESGVEAATFQVTLNLGGVRSAMSGTLDAARNDGWVTVTGSNVMQEAGLGALQVRITHDKATDNLTGLVSVMLVRLFSA